MFRPSNVQSKRMDDVGTRSIFTAEQVGPHVNNLDRDVIFFVRQDMFRESVRKFMQDTLAPQQVHSFRQ